MIQRFSFGHPIPTGSIEQVLPLCGGSVPFLTPAAEGWTYRMREDCVVYGLGEMPCGLNKRGWHYIANNTDESHHIEEPDYELYVLSGGDENALCKEFRALIGRSYIPPKWAKPSQNSTRKSGCCCTAVPA